MFVKTDIANQIVQYPYDLDTFRNENRNVSLPVALNDNFLKLFHVFPVYDDVKPQYDSITQYVVKKDKPYFDGSNWLVGWNVIDKTSEQIQAEFEDYRKEYREKINTARDDAIFKTINVPVNESTIVPVDLRKDTADIQNISGLTQTATLQKINADDTPLYFRGADDNIYTLTPEEVITIGTTVSKRYSSIYAKSWVMKDQLKTMTSIDQINTIVIDFED